MGCQVLSHFLKMVYITCLAILLYFFFPSSYIILTYESIRKLHSPLLCECLYIMASELLRMLCLAPLPAVSQEAQADVEQLFIHFFFFLNLFILNFFLPSSEAVSAPPGVGWVQASACPC